VRGWCLTEHDPKPVSIFGKPVSIFFGKPVSIFLGNQFLFFGNRFLFFLETGFKNIQSRFDSLHYQTQTPNMSYGAEDPIAHASWTSNAILQPTTEEEFRKVYSDRDLFYAVLKGPTETVIRDHLAGGTQNNPPDFDGGLYARRSVVTHYVRSEFANRDFPDPGPGTD
jgi:hypothetical protein